MSTKLKKPLRWIFHLFLASFGATVINLLILKFLDEFGNIKGEFISELIVFAILILFHVLVVVIIVWAGLSFAWLRIEYPKKLRLKKILPWFIYLFLISIISPMLSILFLVGLGDVSDYVFEYAGVFIAFSIAGFINASIFVILVGIGLGFMRLRARYPKKILMQKQLTQKQLERLQGLFTTATNMLASDNELVRIGGCYSLANLGKANESMKVQCVRLLFAFINNPYIENNDKGKSFDELFSADKSLRPDIQQAIASFSSIYEHYGEAGVDDDAVNLPSYFWKNEHRGCICLIKANLHGVDLQEADISGANMLGVRGVTKEQILSAKWGYDNSGYSGPPQLPESLLQDEDVKKWLETPAYDER